VKTTLASLDLVFRVKQRFDMRVTAYDVSGQGSRPRAAAHGWLDETRAALESLTDIRRAGAGIILTCFVKEAARQLA
jgi:porphobilinogen synthase